MGVEPTTSGWKPDILPLNYSSRCQKCWRTPGGACLSRLSVRKRKKEEFPMRGGSIPRWWKGSDLNRRPADLVCPDSQPLCLSELPFLTAQVTRWAREDWSFIWLTLSDGYFSMVPSTPRSMRSSTRLFMKVRALSMHKSAFCVFLSGILPFWKAVSLSLTISNRSQSRAPWRLPGSFLGPF